MKTKLKTIALAIGLLTALAGTNTYAASLAGTTAIDLNFLDLLNFSGSATLVPDFGNEFTDATVTANGPHFANDPVSASLNISENFGTVSPSANSTSMLSTISIAELGFGNAVSEYILDYTVVGDGQIEVTVPYEISIDAQTSATADPGSMASGLVSIEQLGGGAMQTEFLDWQFGMGNGLTNNIGLLSIILDVMDGDSGQLRFYAEVGADLLDPTVVPLPAPALLMLSGLLGISLTGRRGAKQAA